MELSLDEMSIVSRNNSIQESLSTIYALGHKVTCEISLQYRPGMIAVFWGAVNTNHRHVAWLRKTARSHNPGGLFQNSVIPNQR
jgi:hypothetical protein